MPRRLDRTLAEEAHDIRNLSRTSLELLLPGVPRCAKLAALSALDLDDGFSRLEEPPPGEPEEGGPEAWVDA